MSINEELKALKFEQSTICDEYRLFHDGTIKMASLTDSGQMGWYVVAKPIPGMSFAYRRYFKTQGDGVFLNVPTLREAVSLRDMIFTAIVEARVHRRIENDISNQSTEPSTVSSGSYPATF